VATRLSLAALGSLRNDIGRPNYRRADLTGGILHFGVGNFHRAHQAAYLDALFNTGRDLDWALVGAGVVPTDTRMRELLAAQDFLTTVVEQSAHESTARVTAPMIDFLPIGDGATIVTALADPAIRIVSLTITEGGYFIDPATGVFDPDQPVIAADAANPASPKSVFGMIAAGLKRRRADGVAPFTVMSCDNIPHNGIVARNAVTGLVRLSDSALAHWIESEVAFPNGMVDRITPATGERERRICADEFGIEDLWPVFCEDYKQWVLEDSFPLGRPALEDVGVQFVGDVTPYELMKIRILNGGHAAIAYPAGLLDIHFVHEAMKAPLVVAFLDRLERAEIIPAVPPVPNTSLSEYYRLVAERFANPKIGDTVRRLCLDGSNRQPKFIVPTIADRLGKELPIAGLALVSAMWCRYCSGTTEAGTEIEPNDPNWDRLQDVARAAKDAPDRWLAMDDIYGEVGRSKAFRMEFATALNAIWADGTKKVLADYVQGQG
jgi:mannitol 2-dehydrogenase